MVVCGRVYLVEECYYLIIQLVFWVIYLRKMTYTQHIFYQESVHDSYTVIIVSKYFVILP